MQGFKKTSAVTPKQILFGTAPMMSVGVVVSSSDIIANSEGRKIVKAGTPLVGSLEARNTAFTVAGSGASDIAGVLLHDVDVTDGNNNGTLLIFGFVNLNNLDDDVISKLTSNAKKLLSGKVTFLK